MTDSQGSFSEVPALLEERNRYDSWLSALAARRDSTPKHVFERVQADYRARLDRVNERIASHRQGIDEERGRLRSRCLELRTDEGARRDERAELELRTHVGELAGAEAEGAFGAVDHAIGLLVEERKGLEARIAELSELLGEKGVVPPEPAVGEGAAPETQAPAVEAVAEKPAPSEAAPAAAEVPVAVAQSVEPAPAAPAAPAATASAAPAPASAAPAAAPKSDTAPAAVQNGAAAAQQETARGRAGRAFDELAFLSSVVGKNEAGANTAKKEAVAVAPAAAPTVGPSVAPAIAPKTEGPLVERRSTEPLIKAPAGIVQEESAATDSLLAGLENSKLAPGHHPLAANVASNTPIVLRPSTTLEQAKTLKCNECGGLNYPTEWYCERCGAELAAL